MNIVPGNNYNAVVWYINGSSVLELLIKIVVFLIFEILGHSILPFTLSLCSFLGFIANSPDVSLHNKSTCVLVKVHLRLGMLGAFRDIHLGQGMGHDFLVKLAGD